MQSEKSDLRNFFSENVSDRVVAVLDRPRANLTNQVEAFVLLTNGEVSNDLLLTMLQRYYPDAQIAVCGESYHWIMRKGHPKLLINITNYSEIGGAGFWNGDRSRGGIGMEITEHPGA